MERISLISVTQYMSAQSFFYSDIYCVTLIELQAHRDAFIQSISSVEAHSPSGSEETGGLLLNPNVRHFYTALL